MTIASRIAATLAALLFASTAAADNWGYKRYKQYVTYEVTITNITRGQVFSPPVLVTHSRDIALFELGQPALDELAIVAEDGAGQPLVDLISPLPEVFEAQATSAPIPPGGSATYEITAPRYARLSVVSMMVNTNDVFIAIDSKSLPSRRYATRDYVALGYDAGSEANNEDCAFVPGPACPPDSGNARAVDGAEGYVYISNGIHGIADLGPAAYDWRNPAAQVSVVRTK